MRRKKEKEFLKSNFITRRQCTLKIFFNREISPSTIIIMEICKRRTYQNIFNRARRVQKQG